MTRALTTQRLLLRDFREEDCAPFAAMGADVEVMEFFPSTLSRAESDALIERSRAHVVEHGFGLWALERRDTHAFVGFTGLFRPSFEAHFTPCVEVGWRLARDAWGQGYASEAARAALAFAFSTLALDEVVSFTVPSNLRSRAVMERIGMTRDDRGDFDHPRLAGHRLQRHVLYRLRRADWQPG